MREPSRQFPRRFRDRLQVASDALRTRAARDGVRGMSFDHERKLLTLRGVFQAGIISGFASDRTN